MKRKLVRQGTSTLMVSLPAKWIKEYKLNKGSEVDIEFLDNNLLVSAQKIKDEKKSIHIKITTLTESSIRTFITNTYRAGYDRITIEFESPEQYQIILNTVNTKLIGFDILKKEENKCVIENLTEPSDNQFENILLKIFFNIEELFNITRSKLNNKKPSEDFKEVEARTQKYDNFCRRTIAKQKIMNERKEFMWTFLAILQHGHRELYHLNNFLKEKNKYKKELTEYLSESENIFHLIKDAYLKKDSKLLEIVHTLEKESVYTKGYKLLKESKKEESIILLHIIMSIKHFYLCTSSLMGLILE